MELLCCGNLKECDHYFENLIYEKSIYLLGDVELTNDEIEKIADIIFLEIQKASVQPYYSLPDYSLTVAIFLVWAGILYYQENNFWDGVYDLLKLPYDQVKWQGILGKIFLSTVEYYRLLEFSDKLIYVTPILAHGVIPNLYLENYFRDLILQIYKERGRLGLSVSKEEIMHLIHNWRKDHSEFRKIQDKLLASEISEDKLLEASEIVANKDKLEKMQSLQNELIESIEVTSLLSMPENWLELSENERKKLRRQLEEYREITRERSDLDSKKANIENNIKNTAEQIMQFWDSKFEPQVLSISIYNVKSLTRELKKLSSSLWRRVIFLWRRSRVKWIKNELYQHIGTLPWKEQVLKKPWKYLPESITAIREQLIERQQITGQLEVLKDTEKEIAATVETDTIIDNFVDYLEKQHIELENEITKYKMNIVRLGKGDFESGIEELYKQREIRQEIEKMKEELSAKYDINTLLENMEVIKKYPDIEKINDELIEIRKEKEEYKRMLNKMSNPLYFLNESTQVFIYQGAETAEKYIYQSILLIQKLDKDEKENITIMELPSRIITAMCDWWERQGRELLRGIKQPTERQRADGDIKINSPVVKLETLNCLVLVEWQSSIPFWEGRCEFTVQYDDGVSDSFDVKVFIGEDGRYYTDQIKIELNKPSSTYTFLFVNGENKYEWVQKGIDNDRGYLLFSPRCSLLEDEKLLDTEGYIIAPCGSKYKPASMAGQKERLAGYWSDYEYCYCELNDIGMALVEVKGKEYVIKKALKLKPGLVGGNELQGVKVDGKVVYSKELPKLIFSVEDPGELRYYGIRAECQDFERYFDLDDTIVTLSDGNVITVNLADICKNNYGVYNLALILNEKIIWNESFTFLPDLKIEFDKHVYPLKAGTGAVKGKMILKLDLPFAVEAIPPAKLIEDSDITKCIAFDAGQDRVAASLLFGGRLIEITIDIPAIRWRRGAKEPWESEVPEIWYEDIGELQVKFPVAELPETKVCLRTREQLIKTRSTRNGILTFNLRQFSDNLMISSLSLEDIYIEYNIKGRTERSLFALVRLCWQADDIEIIQEPVSDDSRRYIVRWKDMGRASNRVLRLWPINMDNVGMFQCNIPDEASQIEFIETKNRLPAGLYRLQLAVYDPWSSAKAEFPKSSEINVMDIVIGSKEEIMDDVFKNGLNIISFHYHGEKVQIEGDFWIHDIERYFDLFEGEERYKGNVYKKSHDGHITELDYNPVSFYFDLELDYLRGLTFLVDRDKDGIAYCRKCREIFWETTSHRECKRQVVSPPDFIFVEIRRGE